MVYQDGFFYFKNNRKTHALMKTHLNRIIFYCLCIMLFQACLLKKKVDRTVSNYYNKRNFNLHTYSSEQIKVNTDSILQIKAYSRSAYKSFFHVPLIFYYFSKDWIKCNINPMILVNSVINGLSSAYETDEQAGALHDKEIELIFKKVPTAFYYKHRGHFVIIPIPIRFLAIHRWSNTELYNVEDDVVLEYVVRDKASHTVIRQGEIRHQLPGRHMRKEEEEKVVFIESFYRYYDDELLTSADEIAKILVEKLN
jgi:hypothetical protein